MVGNGSAFSSGKGGTGPDTRMSGHEFYRPCGLVSMEVTIDTLIQQAQTSGHL